MSELAANYVSVAANSDDLVTYGSGNVFADIGVKNPDEAQRKANLVIAIRQRIEQLGLSQTKAAAIMGISQPDVSKLLRGRVSGYSLDRLLDILCALGSDVQISVRTPKIQREGRMSLLVDMVPA